MSIHSKPFTVLHQTRDKTLTAYPGIGIRLTNTYEEVAYEEYGEGKGEFKPNYGPNTIVADLAKADITGPGDAYALRLGAVILEARADNTVVPAGATIEANDDIETVDGTTYAFNYEGNIWIQS